MIHVPFEVSSADPVVDSLAVVVSGFRYSP